VELIIAGLRYIGETPECLVYHLRSSVPEPLVPLAQWSIAVEHLVKAIFGLATAVAVLWRLSGILDIQLSVRFQKQSCPEYQGAH
jgi:hypothetical protein